VLAKVRRMLNSQCRAFIANSPFVLVASADATGELDISPKGDPAGFVRVLDDTTLAIPDRPGNRRADTFLNLLQRPQVALLFLIPGKGETLRVNGSAVIVRDPWLREQMAVDGKVPELATVVTVREAFFHCPKCFARSGVWQPAQWPGAQALADCPQMPITVPLY
jgi:PPOX class probable FMN-dependent enzyme